MTSETPIGEQWAQLAIEMLSELRQDYAPGELKETDGRKAIAWLRSKLAAKEAEIAELREKLDRYTRRSESGESLEDYFDLVGELEKERAKVVRLMEVLQYVDDTYCFTNDERVTGALASLDPQAERDAAVLRAVDGEYARHNHKTPTVEKRCGCDFCQAVRGDTKVNTSD